MTNEESNTGSTYAEEGVDGGKVVYLGGVRINTVKNQMKPRNPRDYYRTPEWAAKAALDWWWKQAGYVPSELCVLDAGAGDGVWGSALCDVVADSVELFLDGVDIRTVQEIIAESPNGGEYTDLYNEFHSGFDFIEDSLDLQYDLVIGNPPFSRGREFFWRALDHLTKTAQGDILFLYPLAFLSTQERSKDIYLNGYAPKNIVNFTERLSFTGDGKSYPGGEYCMIHWQRVRGKFVEDAKMHWLYTGLAPKERRK